MNRTPLSFAVAGATLLLFFGCAQATTTSTTAVTAGASTVVTTAASPDLSLSMSSSSTQIQEIANSTTKISLTLDLGTTPHEVYLAFTNTSLTSGSSKPTVSGLAEAESATDTTLDLDVTGNQTMLRDLPHRSEMPRPIAPVRAASTSGNRALSTTTTATSTYTVGDTRTFSYYTYDDSSTPSGLGTATLAVQVRNTTQNRILNVWSMGTSVTKVMSQALADRFLAASGSGSDIYSWDTGVFGREYDEPGTTATGKLITPTGEIDIVLADLNPKRTSQSSYVYGYFYSANNYVTYVSKGQELSNARLAFFLDGPLLATATGTTWEVTDASPAAIVSTLAHEFQHMIHYYQKTLVHSLSTESDSWINEMSSMAAEDLVADKLGGAGPRGVPLASDGTFDYTSGTLAGNDQRNRLAMFNGYYPLLSLTTWQDTVYDYSMAYSFGSWLARNYGGPDLFRSIVQNSSADYHAVLSAISSVTGGTETMASLMRHWSAAVLTSGSGMTGAYNLIHRTGSEEDAFAFTQTSAVTKASMAFSLGSLNYWKYYAYGTASTVGPRMASSLASLRSIPPMGLYLYRYPTTLTGTNTLTISLPATVDVTVVTKASP